MPRSSSGPRAPVQPSLPLWSEFDASTLRGKEGFFRVGRTRRGQWWLLDPENRPFLSKGVTSVNRAGTQGGRYAPPGEYARHVDRLYGTGSPEAFVASVLERMRRWNLNTLGAWTTPDFFGRGMPYMEIIEFTKASGAPLLENPLQPDQPHRIVDVFHPLWPEAADRLAAELAAPRRDCRELIGYFTDNEITFLDADDHGLWAQTRPEPHRVPPERPSLLQVCLAQPDTPAGQAAWAHALAPHGGDLASLARAWGIELPDRQRMRELTAQRTCLTCAAYLYDNHTFVREFARRYFSTVATAIRRHDPHHLILGIRFGGPPGRAVLEACVAPHVDVLSANNYQSALHERVDLYARLTGMPILIGEFAWASGHFLEVHFEGERVGTPPVERMLRMGRQTLERALPHPHLVGYTWYRWVEGDPQHPRLSDHGLVSYGDTPHPHHPELLTLINARAEALRCGDVAPYDQRHHGHPLEA
jgi:hypothetical protein